MVCLFRNNNLQRSCIAGGQQRQQQHLLPLLQQQHTPHLHINAKTCSSTSRHPRHPTQNMVSTMSCSKPLQLAQQVVHPSWVVSASAQQPSTPQQPRQKQQQQQQQPVTKQQSGPNYANDDEFEGEGEYEYLDEDEGEWEEEDEYWEDEEGEEGDTDDVTPNVKQIPQDLTTVEFTQDDFVEVGLISRPHGIRGEVKVQLITDEPKKRVGTPGKRLWLQALPLRSGLVPPSAAAERQAGGSDAFKQLRRVVVQSGRVARPGAKGKREEWAVKFEGVNDRDQAATLAGHKLLLALCDREAQPSRRDEFFIDQLVGLKAVDASSGVLIGLVTEVYDNGASYSLLRIRLAPEEGDIQDSKYRSVLVPFVTDMVPTVDVAGGQLGMNLPEGLLETASSTKLRNTYTPEQQAQLRQQLERRRQQQRDWQQRQQQQTQ